MGEQDRRAVKHTSFCLLKTITTIATTLLCRHLLGAHGYGYCFAISLGAIQVSGLAILDLISKGLGLVESPEKSELPMAAGMAYVAVSGVSLAFFNLSLMVNDILTLQVVHILTIPISGFIDRLFIASSPRDWRYHVFGGFVLMLAVLMIGKGCGSDFYSVLIASVSSGSFSIRETYSRHICKQFSVSMHELSITFVPIQAMLMLGFGPVCDRLITGQWIYQYEYNVPVVLFISVCSLSTLMMMACQRWCSQTCTAILLEGMMLFEATGILIMYIPELKVCMSWIQVCISPVLLLAILGYMNMKNKQVNSCAQRAVISIAETGMSSQYLKALQEQDPVNTGNLI